MMWPTVCRTVHSSATRVGVPVGIGQRREGPVELPARDRHRLQCRDRRSEPLARTVAAAVAIAAIADSSDSWMR